MVKIDLTFMSLIDFYLSSTMIGVYACIVFFIILVYLLENYSGSK